ncbi:MAG: ATP-binding protein [Pseudomonadota bacterium]
MNKSLQSWIQRQLFEQVPCNIAIIDKNFTIVDHNKRFQEMFGYGIGKPCYQVYKKQNQRCAECIAAQTFTDGKVRVNDEIGMDCSGNPAYYLVHVEPIAGRSGEIPYIIEMSQDITETKHLKREYHTLFEKVPCTITILNRDYRIVRGNKLMHETFGTADGQHCWEVFKRRSEKCEDCPAEKSFLDGGTYSSEHIGFDKDGEKTYYMVTTAPLSRGGNTNHIMEMAVDLTRLRQVEVEKTEAERLAKVGETVASLSHGIKNILSGLEGGVYIFETGRSKDDQRRIDKGWKILNRNIKRISSVTHDLLSFSKRRIPKVIMVNPADLVSEVVELFLEAARKQGVELIADLPDEMTPAPFEPDGMRTCLDNLVSNAIDACRMSEKEACTVTVRCIEDLGAIVFEVDDNGCGIEEDKQNKVLADSFTTKGSKGTGLGLMVTRKITQEHGGRITFESTQGKGTCFKLVFPRSSLPCPEEMQERTY